MPIPTRDFGRTGLRVPLLGLGAGQIGDARVPEEAVARLLNAALDLGATLIDTARGYGLSEERIGRHLAHRRGEFTLSTKVGYDVLGHADWTRGCVEAGVDAALERLKTDRIDIVHLHSCPLEVLERGEVLRALEEARRAGKVRAAAYSGENEALRFAAESGRFQSVQASVNLCDQYLVGEGLESFSRLGLGVIAKRPLANAPWRHAELPAGRYVEEYWRRWTAMGLARLLGPDADEAALRFTAFLPGVHCAIVGTTSVEHLRRNAAALEKGPLAPGLVAQIRALFAAEGEAWAGQV